MNISKEAFDLIVAYEVTSEAYYTKNYQRPLWPGLLSGVTIGIGYDLGHHEKVKIAADWKDLVDIDTLKAMMKCSGIIGKPAKVLTENVKNSIVIPWNKAITVFRNSSLGKYTDMTVKALPNTELLTPNQLGALVSLVYNRGSAGFTKSDDKYIEMRAIKEHMEKKEFSKIPEEFRKMKRLWPDMKGLLLRREAEAKLFEK